MYVNVDLSDFPDHEIEQEYKARGLEDMDMDFENTIDLFHYLIDNFSRKQFSDVMVDLIQSKTCRIFLK